MKHRVQYIVMKMLFAMLRLFTVDSFVLKICITGNSINKC